MKVKVQFLNFEGLGHLHKFVEDVVHNDLGKFESWSNFDAKLILKTIRARSEYQRPRFECDLFLSRKNSTDTIVVKKNDEDFYNVVRSCVRVAEKLLRRASKVRVSQIRNQKNTSRHSEKFKQVVAAA